MLQRQSLWKAGWTTCQVWFILFLTIKKQKSTCDKEDWYPYFPPKISNTKGNTFQETGLFESKDTEINTYLGVLRHQPERAPLSSLTVKEAWRRSDS